MLYDKRDDVFQKEIVDNDKLFKLVYSTKLSQYIMIVPVFWIATYDRYYIITENDYELYNSNKEAFYKNFERELSQNSKTCFTENFIGSSALRDYDGVSGFQNAFPTKDGITNPFQHYKVIDNVLFARIVWQDEEIYVPPVQVVLKDVKYIFPLREKCEYQLNKNGVAICMKLKKEFYQ